MLLPIEVSNTLLIANQGLKGLFGKQHIPTISLKPACFEIMGVNRGAATERAGLVVEAFQKVVGRVNEMPILSEL